MLACQKPWLTTDQFARLCDEKGRKLIQEYIELCLEWTRERLLKHLGQGWEDAEFRPAILDMPLNAEFFFVLQWIPPSTYGSRISDSPTYQAKEDATSPNPFAIDFHCWAPKVKSDTFRAQTIRMSKSPECEKNLSQRVIKFIEIQAHIGIQSFGYVGSEITADGLKPIPKEVETVNGIDIWKFSQFDYIYLVQGYHPSAHLHRPDLFGAPFENAMNMMLLLKPIAEIHCHFSRVVQLIQEKCCLPECH